MRRGGSVFGGLALLAVMPAVGCRPSAAEVDVPAFAARLPGHTVAVVWGAQERIDALAPVAELERTVGLTATTVDGARAWLGTPGAVAWPSLAANALFRAGLGELPRGEGGSMHAFVDLQQVVDMLQTEAERRSASAPGGVLQALVVRQALDTLGLRSLTWATASERTEGDERVLSATVAASEVAGGVMALLAPGVPTGLPRDWPRDDGAVFATVAFVPAVASAMVRDLLSGEQAGPLQMAQEMLRGPRLQAGLRALSLLSGSACASVGTAHTWLALPVSDASAFGDLLDELAQPAGEGWALAGWRFELEGSLLVVQRGAVPTMREPLPPTPGPGLSLALPERDLTVSVRRAEKAPRLLVRVRDARW